MIFRETSFRETSFRECDCPGNVSSGKRLSGNRLSGKVTFRETSVNRVAAANFLWFICSDNNNFPAYIIFHNHGLVISHLDGDSVRMFHNASLIHEQEWYDCQAVNSFFYIIQPCRHNLAWPDLLSAGLVQKKMSALFNWGGRPCFWKKLATFLVITVRVSAVSCPKKTGDLFLLLTLSRFTRGLSIFPVCKNFWLLWWGPFLWGPCSAEHAEHA